MTLVSMISGLSGARADPAGAPVYRALAGGGSATTDEFMNALAGVVTVNGQKVLASYDAAGPGLSSTITTKDPATNPDCTLNRPAGDAAAQGALRYSMGAGDGCLDFARLGGEPVRQSINPVTDVTYLPYALDGITYATDPSRAFYEPSLDDLHNIFVCGASSTRFDPYLPASGSQLRSEWLAALNISEQDVSAGKYPCIKEYTQSGTPITEKNIFTAIAADPYAIFPISLAQYATHGWPGVQLGNIKGALETDGRGPVVPDTTAFPDGVTYAKHLGTRDLSPSELTDIYQCRMTQVDGKPVTPDLPVASSVRSAWLGRVGITETDLTAGRYPCVHTTTGSGSPIQVNDGTALGIYDIVPYSITDYIHQALAYSGGAAITDKRHGLVLGGLLQSGGVVKRPFVLNTGYGQQLVHQVYNVIPAENQRISPWREVFTGKDSLICQNTALIGTYGFTPLAPEACGGGGLLTDPVSPSYQIRNAKSGKCLAINGASTANGAPAVQRTCAGTPEQRWTWYGTNGRQLKNTNSGQCLAIGSGSTANGAQAIQWPCGSGTEQQWTMQADPAGSGSRLVNVNSSLVLSVSGGGSTADGAGVIQWAANNGPEQDWTPETATTLATGDDVSTSTKATSAPAGKTSTAATPNDYASVTYPQRLVDVRNGRCRFQGYWLIGAYSKGGVSGPIGGSFLNTEGYLNGPNCAVTMNLQVVNYQFRAVAVFAADHYYNASKPTSAGHNERWMFWGPILGGAYYPRIGNTVYLLSYSLQDLTAGSGSLPSIGQVWGPPANWCDHWPPPSLPPGCAA